MTAEEFLRKKNLLIGDCTQFLITFDDGKTIELTELLEEYYTEKTDQERPTHRDVVE